ncbi:hypothetical protein M413DRAFT_444399 [Hebeloma cylindrosporum]|uniref:Uncharacterized protein n=1 Tax=Hebeloma cylindrosporum TaxID=76867 RepID=A0A0C3CEV5_HEBCY|nr:hypothetical protein M413DRAFT_444399 [Hebeloma cylindrosporum h7]
MWSATDDDGQRSIGGYWLYSQVVSIFRIRNVCKLRLTLLEVSRIIQESSHLS